MLRTRRNGLTLMEVLVTLAILAVGLLAIMTLFPLAAVNMARAVKDDRSYQCARSMDGLFRAYWKAEIVEKAGNGDPTLFNAMDDPDGPTGTPGFLNLPAAGPYEWSYPVFVDPWGYAAARPNTANLTAQQLWIGDNPTNIPRRTMTLFGPNGTNTPFILSSLSLKDTVGYDTDLRLTADREYRYNALAVIQRPLNSNRYAANLTIVAFDNRPLLFAPAGSEAVFNAVFTPGTTTISVTHAVNAGPNIRRGNWVMDASVNNATNVLNGTARPLIRHANFYQVVSVTPTSTTTTDLEVQTAISTPTDNNANAYNGTLVVLDGVSGVYQRPPLAAGE